MRQLIQQVQKEIDILHNHPFLQWLSDESIPAQDRLALWFPHMAGMILGFRDMYALVFPYSESEAAEDELKKVINDFCALQVQAGEKYLKDLARLGIDKEMAFIDILKFLWDESRNEDRQFLYRLCQLAKENSDPISRYALIAFYDDIIYDVLFHKLARIARQCVKENGLPLRYVSQVATGIYTFHPLEVELDDTTRSKLIAILREISDDLAKRWLGTLEYAKQNQSWLPLAV